MNKIFVDQIKKKGDVNKPGPGTYYQNFYQPPGEKSKKEGGAEGAEGEEAADDAKSDNDVRRLGYYTFPCFTSYKKRFTLAKKSNDFDRLLTKRRNLPGPG